MKQIKALYCLTVGLIVGASLNKTNNYDLVNNGYSFKVNFTPVTFVKLSDLNQPVHCSGQTYIFGFAPQELYRIAALTKKDLEDALQAEQNWVNLTKKKLQSGWEKVAAAVATEAQAVERAGGAPEIPSAASQTSSAIPATPPAMAEEDTPQPPEPPAGKSQESQGGVSGGTAPVTGETARKVKTFNVYIASAKASAQGSLSVGYSAVVSNLETGEVTELGKGGYTKEFGKMVVLALREAFEAGIIPPSTKIGQTVVTVYTSNDFVAKMFANNYLRGFAKKEWKKRDGKLLAHKEEWERVWNQASHMLVNAVLCEPDGADLKSSTDKAQEFAEADHQKRYGLIGPGSTSEK